VFNLTRKYIPIDHKHAVHIDWYGFGFGWDELSLSSQSALNENNKGRCFTGKHRYYDIEEDVSPLTNQKERFTCGELEVYKVVYK
jgi:hypothetical protein